MIATKPFLTNRTQAVRLPRAVAFPAEVEEVEVLVTGRARVVIPAGRRWDWFFDDVVRVSDDFMRDREQPPVQERAGW
jgi:antitoxin VapB